MITVPMNHTQSNKDFIHSYAKKKCVQQTVIMMSPNDDSLYVINIGSTNSNNDVIQC